MRLIYLQNGCASTNGATLEYTDSVMLAVTYMACVHTPCTVSVLSPSGRVDFSLGDLWCAQLSPLPARLRVTLSVTLSVPPHQTLLHFVH
jgi:hypothetical protein